MTDIEKTIHTYRHLTGYDVRIEFDSIANISIIDRETGNVIASTGATSLSCLGEVLDSYSPKSELWQHKAEEGE